MPNHFSTPYRTTPLQSLRQPGFSGVGYGPLPTDDLTHVTKDELFKFQLQLPDPCALNSDSLIVAKICETAYYAQSVHRTLIKEHVLTAQNYPDTTKIDKHLVSKIAIISVPKQRELVNLLFWWEEEVQRLKGLQAEKERLASEQGELGKDEVERRVGIVEGETRRLPSERAREQMQNQNESVKARAVGERAAPPPPYPQQR